VYRGVDARATLLAAAGEAAAGGDVDRLVDIYTDLVDVEARLTSDYQLGEGWGELAAGTLVRLGPRVDKQLRLGRDRGRVAQRAGKLETAKRRFTELVPVAAGRGPNDELAVLADLALVEADLDELDAARGHLDRAMTLARAELGPNHPKVAMIGHDLGTVAYRQGRYAEAETLFAGALAVRERAYGPDDADTGLSSEMLGIAELAQDKLAQAQPHLERAVAVMTARLGPDHVDVANALNDIGGAYHRAGLYDKALEVGKRALAIREKALGAEHADVAQSLINVAIESKALGQWDIVEPNYRRAIAILEKVLGKDHAETGIAYLNFAEALRVQGKLDASEAAYARSHDALAKSLGESHPALAHVWNGQGQLALARGDTAHAIPLLEKAVAIRDKDPSDATALAESRFALARALASGARAKQLAMQARDAYRAAGKAFTKELAAVEAWLAKE
jgi:tetratricopeptide (TPR) repeat protein